MEPMFKLCSKSSRWRKPVLVTSLLFVTGLIMFDIMMHMTISTKGVSTMDARRKRMKRSVDDEVTEATDVLNETPVPNGAIFTRWGRPDCPPSSALVYKGVMGSGYTTHKGGSAEYLCLTDEPEWLGVIGSISKHSYLCGVEYQPNLLGLDAGQSRRTNKLMIPGRTSCMAGWTREYFGYLMSSEYKEESNRGFVCVDAHPKADWAGSRSDGGATLTHVYSSCGSLPCPKYHESGVATCVVCTR